MMPEALPVIDVMQRAWETWISSSSTRATMVLTK